MDKTVDYAYFTRKMFIRSVLPAPLAAIGLALAEIGDTILVGHAIGMDGLAAIGFISPLFLLTTFFVFGLSMGGHCLQQPGARGEKGRRFRYLQLLSQAQPGDRFYHLGRGNSF